MGDKIICWRNLVKLDSNIQCEMMVKSSTVSQFQTYAKLVSLISPIQTSKNTNKKFHQILTSVFTSHFLLCYISKETNNTAKFIIIKIMGSLLQSICHFVIVQMVKKNHRIIKSRVFLKTEVRINS